MSNLFRKKFVIPECIAALLLIFVLIANPLLGDEVKWITVGMLHNWFSSAGCEQEVGRTHATADQQDGFQYPALYEYEDMQAAKALWICARNYDDPIAGKVFDHKVVHCGPRVLDETSEFMPQTFKLVGRANHPTVVVDGTLASTTVYRDVVDEVNESLAPDRMLYNVVNTSLGVTLTRRVYAYSSPYHDEYFIYDFTLKNTGIYDLDGSTHNQTLEDVVLFMQYRWAPCKHLGAYGYYYAPQQVTWGHATVNEALHPAYGDDIRATYAWQGLHSKYEGDNIGGPNLGGGTIKADGFLGGAQFPGVLTIHADTSPDDPTDDTSQPGHLPYIYSDDAITQPNEQFNAGRMTQEYLVASSGIPEVTHAAAVGDGNADELPLAGGGGVSQGVGYGPYTLAPGDSVHIVMAEAAGTISWEKRITIGDQWFNQITPYEMPEGGTTTDRDEFKNAWVFSGVDSLMKYFNRAQETWDNGLVVDDPPPPPNTFMVNSGGDRIVLEWTNEAESYEHFGGYRVYRSLDTPDTTFEMIYECGQGTDNALVNRYEDKSARRGFDYYYYITTYDDGTVNTIKTGMPIESSLFWTRTTEPAFLRRMPGENLADIRIVPNPYNINAKEYQFGSANQDRLMFYNLPPECLIKIFTERGDLIETINHNDGSGDEEWRSISSSRQVVVSGVYIAHFETPEGESIYKKFIVIR